MKADIGTLPGAFQATQPSIDKVARSIKDSVDKHNSKVKDKEKKDKEAAKREKTAAEAKATTLLSAVGLLSAEKKETQAKEKAARDAAHDEKMKSLDVHLVTVELTVSLPAILITLSQGKQWNFPRNP